MSPGIGSAKAVVYSAECKKTVAFGQSTDGLPACRIGYF